ncbi:MAG: adenosylcobinamide-phosphate synthase CbiB [Ruminococcus sp.]|nr:adenosylcobinamide-phosphate synthase CbiB [Ruminococcus sp.]
MRYILIVLPLIIGFVLDSVIGDPYSLPHPIRAVGRLISYMEKFVRKHFFNLKKGGIFLTITVIIVSTVIPLILLIICYKIHIIAGVIAESILCCYMIAAKCLQKESMKVCGAAEKNDIEAARIAVSMIVGRDTDVLDIDGIIRAAVETVAENTSDGVTAPMFYMGIGGAAAGFFYKSVNTMDSMIGYKNEKYADIGWFAAILDDILNFIPSRLTAIIMIVLSPIIKMDGRNAYLIWKRDSRNHASPNSAQTESACAGALHIRLAGDAWYFGKLHKKPYIGDDDRPIEPQDIRRANQLMYVSSVVMLIIACAFKICIYGGVFYES